MSQHAASPAMVRRALTAKPLSQHLRIVTAPAHGSVERALGLPGTIRGRADLLACLRLFYRLYRPLEEHLLAFPEWRPLAVAPGSSSARLAADLARLAPGAPLPPDADAAALPALPSFAHALGALYVLEGASLGGQVINRALREAAIDGIDEASAFFPADASHTIATWRAFRADLDRHGRDHPDDAADVAAGAERTFASVERWMHQARWSTAPRTREPDTVPAVE